MLEAKDCKSIWGTEKASPRFGGRTGAQGGGWVEEIGRGEGFDPGRSQGNEHSGRKAVLHFTGLQGWPWSTPELPVDRIGPARRF